jgi:Uma2 family endonuclease
LTPGTIVLEQTMVTQPKQRLTPSEYLAFERASETKNEYIDGFLVAMSGATPRHVLITVIISAEIHRQFKGRPCRVFTQDLRVRVAEAGMYAYPDIAAVCGEPEFEEGALDVLTNPTLIVEVLSESTEAYDRGRKFACYRQRASLQEYVLVAQDRVSVERYSRQDNFWVLTEATSLDDVLDLPSIGCTLALRDVYDKVEGLAADG